MCAEIENEFTKGKYRLADMKMNEIKRKFWPKVGMLKDANGIVLNEPEKKKDGRNTQKLYKNNATTDEAITAIKALTRNKAPGNDNIPISSLLKKFDSFFLIINTTPFLHVLSFSES